MKILFTFLIIVILTSFGNSQNLSFEYPSSHIYCGTEETSSYPCDNYSLPFFPISNDTLRALVVFCNYPSPSGNYDPKDINPNYVYMQYWPKNQAQTKPTWADSIICPTTTNIWNPSLTGLFKQSSNGKFFLIGDVYDSLYIFKHQASYYGDSGRRIGYAVRELLENIDPYVNYSIYDKFDPFDLDHDSNKREKDGIVDFIFIIFRFTNSAVTDNPPPYSGIASLGGKNNNFNYAPEITLDSTRVLGCFPGSGCLADMHFPNLIGIAAHEFAQHYFYGSLHYDTLGVYNLSGGGIGSSEDRERLGWNSGIQYTPTINDSIVLRDYVTTGDYIKINRSNRIFIENRRRLNYYSSLAWNDWKYLNELPLFPIQRDSGLLIYQKIYPYGNEKFLVEHADGKWDWLKCNNKYVISNPVYYNTFYHNLVSRYTGESVMRLAKKNVVDVNCNIPVDPELNPRSVLSYIAVNGDSNTCFDINYNQVYSPWSNPGIKVNYSTDSLTIELVERKSTGELVVKVYFTNITQAFPSKPQLIKTARQFFGSPIDAFHPLIFWNRNMEPDLKEYKIYKGQIFTAGQDASSYNYLGTTTDTFFVDNTTLYRTGGGSGPCERYSVTFSYRISSVDLTNKESVKSERDTITGYTDPCGAIGPDNLNNSSENENLLDTYLKNDLLQNYPNPFNPITKIKYTIEESGWVTFQIYDISGKRIIDLVNEYNIAGEYNILFDASNYDLPSGIYYYKLVSKNFNETKRMVLIK
ncbi:MAG: T9SS type A sorting domain-containing protein [Bacteroidota bacterium]|nr:T9SS type A sorting domain-containing protein [Bacteroidota bacterium]